MSAPTKAAPAANRRGLVVVAICFAAIVLDGYDLIVFGAIVPALLSHPEWDLTPAAVGLIGSYTLIGMVVGGLVIGALTDVLGRRKIIIACVLWFNLGAVACAMAPTPELLSFRLPMGVLYLGVALAGLGSIGTQLLLNGYAAASYPAHARATAVGIILSIGRLGAITGPIMVGLMLGSGLGHQWNFYAFLIPAAVGLAAILLMPRRMPAVREREQAPEVSSGRSRRP